MANPQRVQLAVLIGASALVMPALSACSGLGGSPSTTTVTQTASFTTTVTEAEAPAPNQAPNQVPNQVAPAPAGEPDRADIPCAATSYTPDAEKDLVDEKVTKEEVDEVLRQGCRAAKWDNDGYWEIEWGDIEVEIYPDGTVRDVDR